MEQQKQLSHAKYWDERYAQYASSDISSHEATEAASSNQEDHEWFRTFTDLQPFLNAQIPPPESDCSILHLGCGTSTLTADLHHMGYNRQVSVDFSSVVIEAMRQKYAHLEGLCWQTLDVRQMRELEDGKFDVAIDKGTLDAMLYGSLWDPEDEVKQNVKEYVNEVARVLAAGGKWLYVTFRQPHFLKPLLSREGIWTLAVHSLTGSAGSFEYFGYVMTKAMTHPTTSDA